MRYRGYGYGAYRGRSRSQTILKIIIVILLIVLILVAGAYVVLEKFGVYTSDGFRLELPFGGGSEDPNVEESQPLVVVSTDPQSTPSPTPEPTPATIQAVELPRSALSDGTAASQVQTAGGSAALFDMKADDGTLGYVSQIALATETGASAKDAALNEAIRTLNGGELYTVARVSCFRDNTVPYNEPTLGVKTYKDYNWRDNGNIRWMSPTSAEVRQYVTDVCLELAGLGFDEILLDNSTYPTDGALVNIRPGDAYDETQFETIITGFYAQVKAALAAQYPNVKLSIVTNEGVLQNGSDSESGQSLTGMAASADRVWARLEEMPAAEGRNRLVAAGMDGSCLVTVGSQAGVAGENWAIWPED